MVEKGEEERRKRELQERIEKRRSRSRRVMRRNPRMLLEDKEEREEIEMDKNDYL